MKTTLTKAAAAGLTALVIGNAAAQESVSKPVGYETLDYSVGFNYLGIRLHEAALTSGEAADVVGADVTLPAGAGASLVPGAVHILEVTSGDAAGALTTFTPADNSDTVSLDDDLSDNFFGGDSFIIRPASTLASIFGAPDSSPLTGAAAPGQSDQVWVVDGAGGFTKYYLYNFFGTTEWRAVDGDATVDGSTIPLIYTDSIILSAVSGGSVVVSGSVKLESARPVVVDGFNYLGSTFPVGATLGSYFGDLASSGLDGAAAPGQSDQVWVPTASSFTKYYFYNFFGTTEWREVDSNTPVADPNSVELPSAFIFQNVGGASAVGGNAPAFYADL